MEYADTDTLCTDGTVIRKLCPVHGIPVQRNHYFPVSECYKCPQCSTHPTDTVKPVLKRVQLPIEAA